MNTVKHRRQLAQYLLFSSLGLLAACDDNKDESPASTTVITAPQATLSVGFKQLTFRWGAVNNADHYRILVNADGASGFTPLAGAEAITGTQYQADISVHLTAWQNAQYLVEACDAMENHCESSANLTLPASQDLGAIGYVKASNNGSNDFFGNAVALSADGQTMAIGAYGENSSTSDINTTANDDASDSGAVYVFRQINGEWAQQAYIKAANSGAGDSFGYALALSDDGTTLAVGAYWEDSSTTGINSTPDEAASNAGAVYVFTFANDSWSQQAYIKASNTGAGDYFGRAVALNADGSTLAVGAHQESSGTTGINSTPDEAASNAGAVYLYQRSNNQWSQQAYIKASNAEASDHFGYALALNDAGTLLAVGAFQEASISTGINGDQTNNSAYLAGAVYVFSLSNNQWTQSAYLKASNNTSTDGARFFGGHLAMNADGTRLAVSASAENSQSTGINSTPDYYAIDAGAAYVFEQSNGSWSQSAYIKASNTGDGDRFGWSIALSADGDTLAIGAHREDSNSTGINGDETDDSASSAGAVYLYTHNGTAWTQKAYVKASNTGAGDHFGAAVALDSKGTTLVSGAYGESGDSTGVSAGVNSSSNDNAPSAGAVYLY